MAYRALWAPYFVNLENNPMGQHKHLPSSLPDIQKFHITSLHPKSSMLQVHNTPLLNEWLSEFTDAFPTSLWHVFFPWRLVHFIKKPLLKDKLILLSWSCICCFVHLQCPLHSSISHPILYFPHNPFGSTDFFCGYNCP